MLLSSSEEAGMEALLSQDAKDWREGCRLRAYELAQQGWIQKAIAQALGVTGRGQPVDGPRPDRGRAAGPHAALLARRVAAVIAREWQDARLLALKKGRRRRAHPAVRGRERLLNLNLLAAAGRGPHLGAPRPNAAPAPHAHARSPVRDQCRRARRAAVPADAGTGL